MSAWTDERPVRTPGMSAKEEILARVRTALAAPRRDAITGADDVPRAYQRADDRQETSTDPGKIRDVLVSRLEDYTATVHRTTAEGLPDTIRTSLEGADSILLPAGLPPEWTRELGDRTRPDSPEIAPRELDRADAVLTGCHTAIAITGTIVLRADDLSGRRAVTLVPDHHVVVVEASQVVLGVPKAMQRMQEDPRATWTWISGPSATSDIELERVEGVHGPRRLQIILVEPEPEPEAESEEPKAATPARSAGRPATKGEA